MGDVRLADESILPILRRRTPTRRYIPAHLGYGDRGSLPKIGALVFAAISPTDHSVRNRADVLPQAQGPRSSFRWRSSRSRVARSGLFQAATSSARRVRSRPSMQVPAARGAALPAANPTTAECPATAPVNGPSMEPEPFNRPTQRPPPNTPANSVQSAVIDEADNSDLGRQYREYLERAAAEEKCRYLDYKAKQKTADTGSHASSSDT